MINKILKTEDGYNIVTDNGGKDDWVIVGHGDRYEVNPKSWTG